MQWFYDGQVRRYLTQFMRIMSNFSWKDAQGKLTQIPVMYGDQSRMAAAMVRKNTENVVPAAPFIACYIKNIEYDQARLQEPTFVDTVNIRERAIDPNTGQYLNTQGLGYTVERIMPAPYKLTFAADLWTTNTEQKLQIWEQLAYLFNPSLELQTTDNYLDWTSLTILQLETTTWSSRTIPQGVEQNIDILNLTFLTPIWITPPAKVKRLGIVTKIIANAFTDNLGDIANNFNDSDTVYNALGSPLFTTVVTPGNYELLVLDNTASILPHNAYSSADATDIPSNAVSWYKLLDLYPGQFRAGLSQIRLTTPDNSTIVAYATVDPLNDRSMTLSFDLDTIPTNTIIDGRGTVDAIINPETYNPANKSTGVRYLILENINVNSGFETAGYSGPKAWKNLDGTDFQAHANSIISWTGSAWTVIFDSTTTTSITYITNTYTGIQYKWDGTAWSKSFEGLYANQAWQLVL